MSSIYTGPIPVVGWQQNLLRLQPGDHLNAWQFTLSDLHPKSRAYRCLGREMAMLRGNFNYPSGIMPTHIRKTPDTLQKHQGFRLLFLNH